MEKQDRDLLLRELLARYEKYIEKNKYNSTWLFNRSVIELLRYYLQKEQKNE